MPTTEAAGETGGGVMGLVESNLNGIGKKSGDIAQLAGKVQSLIENGNMVAAAGWLGHLAHDALAMSHIIASTQQALAEEAVRKTKGERR